MNFVPFNQSRNTRIEYLYNNVDSISVETTSGHVYHNCTVEWEQGWTRSYEFDNYRFKHGEYDIWPESVVSIAIEDEGKQQFMKDYPEGEE